jgi:hypothetical protein
MAPSFTAKAAWDAMPTIAVTIANRPKPQPRLIDRSAKCLIRSMSAPGPARVFKPPRRGAGRGRARIGIWERF